VPGEPARANMERLSHCPICRGDVAGARRISARQRDDLYRCPRCASVFSNPRYTPDELAELYRQEYYLPGAPRASDRAAEQAGAERLHRTILGILAQRYPQAVRAGARLLDFGCGLGYFLAEAGKAGIRGIGVELSAEAAEFARTQLGVEVVRGDESALEGLDGEFDLIAAWEVIEHVLQPRDALRLLVGKLAPGGVLGLSLPNIGCWRFRIQAGRWFNAANPAHLSFPTWPAIRGLLTELGLTDVRRAVFWGGRRGFGPLANLVQYLARALNLGSDMRVFAQKPAG